MSTPLRQPSSAAREVGALQVKRYKAIARLVEALGSTTVGIILKAAHEPPQGRPSRDVNAFFPFCGLFYGEFCLGYTMNQPSKRAAGPTGVQPPSAAAAIAMNGRSPSIRSSIPFSR